MKTPEVLKIDNKDDAVYYYGQFRPLILKALEYDHETSEEDVLKKLDSRHATFFVADDSFAICTICEWNNKKSCHIWVAGGNIKTLLEGSDVVKEWAEKWGANRGVVSGRRGWNRILPRFGWLQAEDEDQTLFFKNF